MNEHVVEDPVLRQRYVFRDAQAADGADVLEVEAWVDPGGGVVPHLHPTCEERSDTAEQVRELLGKGCRMAIFTTDDCRGTYEALSAKGVEFTQEPVERFYGIDCAIRDPFENHIRITQAAPTPAEPPPPRTTT